ncbi:hypothetical protein JAAARDRAFT_193900 [Jaapia argillacea MUCL 33604]|uniref:Uncharacterized protein n=1 Tax=Jaapia argillacea MUCL 33604 TaxID=933084 RepID=A0A067PS04_9AGAM|nr:hypothetical protein JAAARDRAFT_193900 [Jaapia argillacea MUCL 33604]
MASASKPIVNSAHQPGLTCLTFSRDGSLAYTGGTDSLVRIWRPDLGTDYEPDVAVEANEAVTSIVAASDCWLSGSDDSQVRRYAKGKNDLEGLITTANGVSIRSLAVDPEGRRVAVASEESFVKIIDLEDTSKITLLQGHKRCIRRVTWHPSGSLLTTSGAEGDIIVWNVSEQEPKQEKVIEGVIPTVIDMQSLQFGHDCSAVWHTSGQYFFAPSRTHEIVTIARSDWTKSSTFSDDASLGDITALALSPNGVYLASASKAGVFIWSTQTRRVLFRFPGTPDASICQLAFSPTKNLLAWTDTEGILTRIPTVIPSTSPDPVKFPSGATSTTVPVKRRLTPSLFDDGMDDIAKLAGDGDGDAEMVDLDNDDWILDDLGGGMEDDTEHKKGRGDGFVKEMVSVTKAQPAFQPGATPMENKKRYLAYNTIGVIEVTDQDTHHIVNVEFHDQSTRKGTHFTDHFKYDLASLGERGALYACQPENNHPAHVAYKPYGTWASQGEWTYDLPMDIKVLGIAAGGPPPTKSQRVKSDGDLGGNGNVVIATSQNELTFLSGSGIERYSIGLDGDFVTMVAGPEWVFVVHRDGATTIDGSQNLTGTLIDFEDFCVLQERRLPIPKGHTLRWVGITDAGAPAFYDSAGVMHLMPRFRIPLRATWARILDTNTLERREGKDESYWPVGVTGDSFMCVILKGRQLYPGFPRPLIQELPLRLPFRRKDAIEGPLEEFFARESLHLDIARDALGDELITDEISRRELALDKELIRLIQNACKNDKLPRALDLTRMLHHVPSFDMAVKVASFYHLIGLQEKMEVLKANRDGEDRLTESRDKRKQWTRDSEPRLPPRLPQTELTSSSKPFQDFRPPPPISRPGLARAKPNGIGEHSSNYLANTSVAGPSRQSQDHERSFSPPAGKRKRDESEVPIGEALSAASGDEPKPRPFKEPQARPTITSKPKTNPFAKKGNAEASRNPFARNAVENKSLHKSESFFDRVEAAESDKGKRPAPGKDKKNGKQTTLFGLPPGPPPEKKVRKKKALDANEDETQSQSQAETQTQQEETIPADSQATDITMTDDSQMIETQLIEPTSERNTPEREIETQLTNSPGAIEWPASPAAGESTLEVEGS